MSGSSAWGKPKPYALSSAQQGFLDTLLVKTRRQLWDHNIKAVMVRKTTVRKYLYLWEHSWVSDWELLVYMHCLFPRTPLPKMRLHPSEIDSAAAPKTDRGESFFDL